MTQEVDDVPALLNHLIEVCLDGEHGYRTATGDVKNTELETVFLHYADQRVKFAKELRHEVERLGGTPSDGGTVSGALHRGWINVKSAVTGANSGAVIAACETGEDSAAAAYGSAVETDIPGETRALVQRQSQQVHEAHSHMLRLKKEAEAGASFREND